jgi:hypothetical protein
MHYTKLRRRFVAVYLCMLFLGDGVKRRPRRIIGQHVGLQRNTEREGEFNRAERSVTNVVISRYQLAYFEMLRCVTRNEYKVSHEGLLLHRIKTEQTVG